MAGHRDPVFGLDAHHPTHTHTFSLRAAALRGRRRRPEREGENGTVTSDPGTELVDVLDSCGLAVRVAPRSEVRRLRLLHAATAVAVRRSDGCLYVHRRTETKDIYPGAYDCWAGGVIASGETPLEGARRELAEELGVRGVPLRPLGVVRWSDSRAHAIYHVFETVWDGPIVPQVTEIAWGDWWTPATLAERLAAPDFVFVPDGRHLLAVTGLLQPHLVRHGGPGV
ncbi:MAG: NUDIX domain-containing protein [Acidothermus sp.]|nr:NUDIX domain-containing protein [Acidothermus sp.]MCL6538003.1 NUDIX domain-containing protein [Acidothermus sp.]